MNFKFLFIVARKVICYFRSKSMVGSSVERYRLYNVRKLHNPLLNSKWPSIGRFVPNQKKSVSGRLTTSLDEFKRVIRIMAVIWNTSCKN